MLYLNGLKQSILDTRMYLRLFVLIVSFFLLGSHQVGYCATEITYTMTHHQYEELMSNLNDLEKINQSLLDSLNLSNVESNKILEQSRAQQRELEILKNQLTTYSKTIEISTTNLEKAQKELNELSLSLKKLEQQRTDYRNQRNIFGAIAIVLAGVLVAS